MDNIESSFLATVAIDHGWKLVERFSTLEITELSRIVVPLNCARGNRSDHDPALPLGTIPMLDDALQLRKCAEQSPDRLPFLNAGLRRSANRVAAPLYKATLAVQGDL